MIFSNSDLFKMCDLQNVRFLRKSHIFFPRFLGFVKQSTGICWLEQIGFAGRITRICKLKVIGFADWIGQFLPGIAAVIRGFTKMKN